MKKYVYISVSLLVSFILISCSSKNKPSTKENDNGIETNHQAEDDNKTNTEQMSKNDNRSDNGVQEEMLYKDNVLDMNADELTIYFSDKDRLSEMVFPIQTIKVPTYPPSVGIEGTTEVQDIVEFFDEQTKDSLLIRLELDDEPIRNLAINVSEVNMTAVLNFSEHIINIQSGDTIIYSDAMNQFWYNDVVSYRSNQTSELDVSDFRQWDELSNIERSFIPTFGRANALLVHLIQLLSEDLYELEAYSLFIGQFAIIGDLLTLYPEPQTELDYYMYTKANEFKQLWSKVSQFNNPTQHKEEYLTFLQELLASGEKVYITMNHILSQSNDKYYGADLYLNAYQPKE